MVRTHPTRRRLLGSAAAAGVALSTIGTVSAADQTRYLVTVNGPGVRPALERAGFAVAHDLADGTVLAVRGPDGETATLEGLDGIRAAAPDRQFTLSSPAIRASPDVAGSPTTAPEGPTLYPSQWDKQVQDLHEAHNHATGANTTLAILDTGIDPAHPDLAANLDETASRLFSSGNPIEADDNPWDLNGHGTHVAGTAAATAETGAEGFGTGIVGTAPAATLVSAKVFWYEDPADYDEFDEPFLTTTLGDILAAIDYAAAIGADAVNMSLGSAEPLVPTDRTDGVHVAYQRVCQYATQRGTVVVAAAGNNDATLQGSQFVLPTSVPGTVSVSATGPTDERAFYSNSGTGEVDVGAPGGGYETENKTRKEDGVEWPFPTNLVLSTVPPDVYGAPYAYLAGTSMAAPQVTGLVGLVRSLEPDLSAARVTQAIAHGADDVNGTGRSDPDLGAGRINAADTVDRVR